MIVIKARNVCDAYVQGIEYLERIGDVQEGRGGTVLVAPHPVVTVYERPQERVLFDERRDANPFFHLFESLWMLGGRRDGKFLDKFVRDFSERYAEADGSIHGAYGYRWRNHWDWDQLDAVIHRLRRDFTDRRVVVSMWDPATDLIGPDDVDPETGSAIWLDDPEPRDVPCNTHVYPRVRVERSPSEPDRLVLDISVLCRSNDVVWGAYGANAVHFSVLQEYLAAKIGVGIGRMYQFSNNWHGYLSVLERVVGSEIPSMYDPYSGCPVLPRVRPAPMFDVPSEINKDVNRFLYDPLGSVYANKWFHNTALPMYQAHGSWRDGRPSEAVEWASNIDAEDWRVACQRWLDRRISR